MAVAFDEGGVRFTFDLPAAVRWESHTAWTQGVGKLATAQPVDFAALLDDEGICLFEAKDFRSHQPALNKKLRSNELADRVAAKFRDSLAGLAWCAGRSGDGSVERISGALFRREPPKVLCVAWTDHDGDAAIADTLRGAIEAALPRRMVCRVVVTSLALEKTTSFPLDWLSAVSLPRKKP